MSQESVYNCLAKSKKPLTAQEIMVKVKISQSCVRNSLKKLYKYNDICFRVIPLTCKNGRKVNTGLYFVKKRRRIPKIKVCGLKARL
jgi:DNA-binding transcriptional regulator GbsR (MarR family)